MRVVVLGCGGSGGVPQIGGNWGNADPTNPKNYRTRPSIYIEHEDLGILVDTTPDVRSQLLRERITRVTHIFYTHGHADHTNGFDDVRYINQMMQQPVPIYADAATLHELRSRFAYAFEPKADDAFYRPNVVTHEITGPFKLGSLEIVPIPQDHGYSQSLGFRFGCFAYNTDVKQLSSAAIAALQGIRVWLVDSLREKPHPTHAHLAQTLEWVQLLRPAQTFLTHMNHEVDYDHYCQLLPSDVRPAYDGLSFIPADDRFI